MKTCVMIFLFNELDILEINLNQLDEVVDKFIIVEYPFSSGRQQRKMYFNEHKHEERFKKFEHKILHKIDTNPYYNQDGLGLFWSRKHSPFLMSCFFEAGCLDDIYVICIDGDVVLRKSVIETMDLSRQASLIMPWMCYWFNAVYNESMFAWTPAAPFWVFKEAGGMGKMVGYSQSQHEVQIIGEAGYHFAKCGGVDSIIENIKGYPHQEFAIDPDLIDPIQVQERIDNLWGWTDKSRGTDPANWTMRVLDYDPNYYPEYVNNNPDKYKKYFLFNGENKNLGGEGWQ